MAGITNFSARRLALSQGSAEALEEELRLWGASPPRLGLVAAPGQLSLGAGWRDPREDQITIMNDSLTQAAGTVRAVLDDLTRLPITASRQARRPPSWTAWPLSWARPPSCCAACRLAPRVSRKQRRGGGDLTRSTCRAWGRLHWCGDPGTLVPYLAGAATALAVQAAIQLSWCPRGDPQASRGPLRA